MGHQTETRASPALEIRSDRESASSESGAEEVESEWEVDEGESERKSHRTWRLCAWMRRTSSKVARDQTRSSPLCVPAKMYLSETARARTELSCLSSWTRSGESDSSWERERPLVIVVVVVVIVAGTVCACGGDAAPVAEGAVAVAEGIMISRELGEVRVSSVTSRWEQVAFGGSDSGSGDVLVLGVWCFSLKPRSKVLLNPPAAHQASSKPPLV